ncbi:putative cysW [Mycobacterium xenopi 4042]|uniref:Putative cysW n=1 Tax=Mycobacterium xenopi 4042 TaxID=1299334 RepID=X8AR91_MYCXE|nr:putative cysW [Mycobacterium xenopi 4042]
MAGIRAGIGQFFAYVSTPAAVSALHLSLLVVAIVVPLNVIFGIPTALVLARNRFRGKGVLQAIIDLPFAVSPVIVGVALIVLWARPVHWASSNETSVQDHLRSARHRVGQCLRHAAVRDSRGRTGAARAGHRPGGGGGDTGFQLVADVLADHFAVRPVGLTYGIVLTIARTLGNTAQCSWCPRTFQAPRRR